MKITLVTQQSFRVVALAAQPGGKTAYALAKPAKSGAMRIDSITGGTVETVEPPKTDAPILDLAVGDSGELWAVTAEHLYRRPSAGAWTEIAPPPDLRFESVEVAGTSVWLTASRSGGSPTSYLLRWKADGAAASPPAIDWK
jgi:hypothetical protein